MPFTTLLIAGIILAGFLISASLWSIRQAIRQGGLLRGTHVLCVMLLTASLMAMALQADTVLRLIGFALAFLGILAIYEESRWAKLMPLIYVLFALALVSGIPLPQAES